VHELRVTVSFSSAVTVSLALLALVGAVPLGVGRGATSVTLRRIGTPLRQVACEERRGTREREGEGERGGEAEREGGREREEEKERERESERERERARVVRKKQHREIATARATKKKERQRRQAR